MSDSHTREALERDAADLMARPSRLSKEECSVIVKLMSGHRLSQHEANIAHRAIDVRMEVLNNQAVEDLNTMPMDVSPVIPMENSRPAASHMSHHTSPDNNKDYDQSTAMQSFQSATPLHFRKSSAAAGLAYRLSNPVLPDEGMRGPETRAMASMAKAKPQESASPHVTTDHDDCDGDSDNYREDSMEDEETHEMREYHPIRPQTQYICSKCGKAYNTRFARLGHVRLQHLGVHCHWPGCNTRTRTEADMVQHFSKDHEYYTQEAAKLWKCTWPGCDKTFTQSSSARRCVIHHQSDKVRELENVGPDGDPVRLRRRKRN